MGGWTDELELTQMASFPQEINKIDLAKFDDLDTIQPRVVAMICNSKLLVRVCSLFLFTSTSRCTHEICGQNAGNIATAAIIISKYQMIKYINYTR